MSIPRIVAIVFIYLLAAGGWMILGTATSERSTGSSNHLAREVAQSWGGPLIQRAPSIERLEDGRAVEKVVPSATNLTVHIDEDARKKGLINYPTYNVHMDAIWTIANPSAQEATYAFHFSFPNPGGTYDSFVFSINGENQQQHIDTQGGLSSKLTIPADKETTVRVSFITRGMETWRYQPGSHSGRVRNLKATITTDFKNFDYTNDSISANTAPVDFENGVKLVWDTDDLITKRDLGIVIPEKLNPGPVTSRITFFAPVCLGFFFLLVATITIVCRIPIHPMHYLFVAGGFFAFHLLLAYLVDHLTMSMSFAIAAVVSCALNGTYLRSALGGKFPLAASLGGQGFFLILFSYSFFFTGVTGLTVAIGSVATLAVLMRVTAQVNWFDVFQHPPKKPSKVTVRTTPIDDFLDTSDTGNPT